MHRAARISTHRRDGEFPDSPIFPPESGNSPSRRWVDIRAARCIHYAFLRICGAFGRIPDGLSADGATIPARPVRLLLCLFELLQHPPRVDAHGLALLLPNPVDFLRFPLDSHQPGPDVGLGYFSLETFRF